MTGACILNSYEYANEVHKGSINGIPFFAVILYEGYIPWREYPLIPLLAH